MNVNIFRRERYKRIYTTYREKEARVIMRQTVDEVQHSSLSDFTPVISGAQSISQRPYHHRIFEDGSLHRTRRIITLSIVCNMKGQQPGSSKVASTKEVNTFCGSTGNVRPSFLSLYYTLKTLVFTVGSGKGVLWCAVSVCIVPW